MRESFTSTTFLILVITLQVKSQSTIDTLFSTAAPSISNTLAEPENATVSIEILDLDDVLASVKNDSKAPIGLPIVPAGFGNRPFMHAVNNNYRKEELMGRTLRLVVPKLEPPYVNYVNFSDAEVARRGYGPGVVIEILKMMGQRLNLTYAIIPSSEGKWGAQLDNGTWTGAFGMMYRKEADILGGAAIMQYDRGLVTDLTHPFQYAPTTMLIRSPLNFHDDTWLILTASLRWEVWAFTIGSIIASGMILYLLVRFLACANEVRYSMVDSVWMFYAVSVQQGVPTQPRSWSCRVMYALWWMGAVTLQATFTGSLVALFAVDKTTMPFNNIQQLVRLVQGSRWRIIMDGTTTTRTTMIRESESQTYRDLWYEMSVNRKVDYVNGTDAAIDLLLANPYYAFLGPEDTLKYWAAVDCRLTMISEGILPTYLSIPFAKDSEYSSYASTLIRDLVERGFIAKWITDYTSAMAIMKGNNKCATQSTAADKYLDLSKAQGAFWVLCAGFGAGIFLFMLEMIYKGVRMIWKNYREEKAKTVEVGDSVDQEEKISKQHSFNSEETRSITSGDVVEEQENLGEKNMVSTQF
ncbi:hypothetical protein PRIPAC_79161 [Pristionchus pacificus]|uniref:Glr-8 n=1 Tax=Pristionchus pacificus TaxID=54126 RepID=A0A2A6CPI3_PRIPA|nr:hypothetical protein PRIPAC_79161 [Pristionchus pacificus]|eukprot:PDM80030.1 glr-8 [Pristionchus pacificus]